MTDQTTTARGMPTEVTMTVDLMCRIVGASDVARLKALIWIAEERPGCLQEAFDAVEAAERRVLEDDETLV
jgi:hypothetical protein